MNKINLFFYSGMEDAPAGGSEDLWSRAALKLVESGHSVRFSVKYWEKPGNHVISLQKAGAVGFFRQLGLDYASRIRRKLTGSGPMTTAIKSLLEDRPDLVIISQGGLTDGLEFAEKCTEVGIPFTILYQANSETFWPVDELGQRIKRVAKAAKQLFFVSRANAELYFMQIGTRIDHVTVVSNPANAQISELLPWPDQSNGISMAFVARLDIRAKGHDVLFQVLALPKWKNRNLKVHLYGNGLHKQNILDMINMFELSETVIYEGQSSNVESIWMNHHAMILPSRFEGTPLSIIEAMICGRPIVATKVAGIPEIVDDGISGFLADAPTPALLDDTLERFWVNRSSIEEMGKKASELIWTKIPADPVENFKIEILRQAGAEE